MKLDIVVLEQLLVSVFVLAVVWLVVGTMINVYLLRTDKRENRRFLPRWIRATAVSLVGLISMPRAASASDVRTTSMPNHGDDDSPGGLNPLLLASLTANLGFAALHLRRQLVLLRRTRFGQTQSTQRVEEQGPPGQLIQRPDWRIVVRVLGPPVVETTDGKPVTFEKGKALELVAWMVEHRETSTRSAARTALWDGDVKDSTFSNVVSEARRALQMSEPLCDEEWIPRTFSDELPLHSGVVTDSQLLEIAMHAFEQDRASGHSQLAKELGRVRNLPFSGANYSWADGEGITTSHVIRVVKAAVSLAEYAIEIDDDGLLFMATERGLRVLPGHEELVCLRMRGHARRGNRSAIKFEWESYARAVEADSWAGAEPSPELEKLARELSTK